MNENEPIKITEEDIAEANRLSLSCPICASAVEKNTNNPSLRAVICANCRFCLGSCPYRAIEKDTDAEVCRVNEAICRGCGTCAAGCPSGAAQARCFTDREMYAEIAGLLDE